MSAAPSSLKEMARKQALAGKVKPLQGPRTTCAMTGEPIELKKVGDKWIAFTSLWTSRPYDFRDSLVYALSHNEGVAPDMPRPGVKVIRDENEPPGPKDPVGPSI